MMGAYPKLVVDSKKISNPDSITKVGSAIFTDNQTVDDVRKVAGYLNPATMSPDSKSLQDELIQNTKGPCRCRRFCYRGCKPRKSQWSGYFGGSTKQ